MLIDLKMGCITSKGVTRSMSIRQELRHGLYSRSAGWEELLTSNGGNIDHLFAFVKSNSFALSSADVMTADINAKAEDAAPVEALVHSDSSIFTRSKSCHEPREREVLSSDRSLSFHTVEEYDALLERIRGTRSLENLQHCFPWDDEDDYVNFQESSSLAEGEDRDETILVEDSAATEEGKHETGSKRKAIAKGLKSLDIDFPAAVGKLKQRMLVYSPGTYVTPKFGSYNDPATHKQQNESQEEKEEDDTVFSPEFLAAFEECMQQLEECMQQLQLEEDTILKHMEHIVPNAPVM